MSWFPQAAGQAGLTLLLAGDVRQPRRRRLPHAAQLRADKAVSHVIHNVDFMLAVTVHEGAVEVLHLIRNQQRLCL